MAERSHSMPQRGSAAALQPFWSERLQRDLQLEALRPRGLPSPGEESLLPVQDAGMAEGGRLGKGRGVTSESSVGMCWHVHCS